MNNAITLVAVIMSVYKYDNVEFCKQSIESLLCQDTSCDIFLYVDGAIPDELDNLIMYYECAHNNINVFRGSFNVGLGAALNYLIDEVLKGDYLFVARMDSDDISKPNRFSEQMSFFNTHHDIDVLGTFCKEFGSSYALDIKRLPIHHSDLADFSCVRCPFIHPTVMFRRSVFDDGFRYPIHTNLTEDMALWFLLLEHGYHFSNIDRVLLDYRMTENTVIRRSGWKKALSEFTIRLHYVRVLNKFSFRNFFLILLRLIFHLLPPSILKLFYKYCR